MTEEYINGYKDGFTSGVDIKHNQKFVIFGYEGHEILRILAEHERNKKKLHETLYHGKQIEDYGDIRIEKYNDSLHLWIGGKKVYEFIK